MEELVMKNTVYVAIEDGKDGIGTEVFAKQDDAWNYIVKRAKEVSGSKYADARMKELERDLNIEMDIVRNQYITLYDLEWYFSIDTKTVK
jgi:hypothetical protein